MFRFSRKFLSIGLLPVIFLYKSLLLVKFSARNVIIDQHIYELSYRKTFCCYRYTLMLSINFLQKICYYRKTFLSRKLLPIKYFIRNVVIDQLIYNKILLSKKFSRENVNYYILVPKSCYRSSCM